MEVNPNGESACAATHMASDKVDQTGGMIAALFTASPVDRRLSAI
jgi:hypothetical protein